VRAPLVRAHTFRLAALALSMTVLTAHAGQQEPTGVAQVAREVVQSVHAELARGKASWYGLKFHGKRTSSGERFDMNDLTAAHDTLPFGTRVLVRNESNGREVVVRINDRGPHIRDRIIDLSKAAAAALGFLDRGEARVVLVEP
jgi:rare lipoprotein A